MSISINSYNASLCTHPTAAERKTAVSNSVPSKYKLEVKITENSILTDSQDFTPGRWRILDNGVKVFNIQMFKDSEALISSMSDQERQSLIGLETRAKKLEETWRAIPSEASPKYEETKFEYTPLNELFSYSKHYKGLVAASENPETAAIAKAQDRIFYHCKEKVLNVLKQEGNSLRNENIRFGIDKGDPYMYSIDKAGNKTMQKLSPSVSNIIKDFWATVKKINEVINISI